MPLNITFLHSDLGIGGAERLVIDAALGLQGRGHRVRLVTANYRPEQSLDAFLKRNLDLRVYRTGMPVSIGGCFRAPCTILRTMVLLKDLAGSGNDPDLVFCDLVPHVIPFIRRASRAKVVYYCHFPDLLLTPVRSFVYDLYRRPLDLLEEAGIRMAHSVIVNSRFTRNILLETFGRLSGSHVSILHPCVDLALYPHSQSMPPVPEPGDPASSLPVLSLNRFDPRKNLGLALESLAQLKRLVGRDLFAKVTLTVAGGYDASLAEQRSCLHNLQQMARVLGLEEQVAFRPNVPEEERLDLLQRCCCVIYTSPGEHFGLGILEAMAAGKAVLAADQGGPREIVRDGRTGILCDPSPESFAAALAKLLTEPERAREMGVNGRRRVAKHFSREAFVNRLDAIVQATAGSC